MGISRSFNIGVSGLRALGEGMGVISDNIANAGTNGFKSGRAEFQDILATSLKGVKGGDQLGTGVRLGHVKLIMSQGDVARTESITDFAISGNGFFRVKTPAGHAYTRDGSMQFNKYGSLTTPDGYEVLGFDVSSEGKITNTLSPIQVKLQTIPAVATKEVKIDMNFDSRAKVLDFNRNDPDNTSNFSNIITVYDSVGTSRAVTMYYNRTSDNTWVYRAMVDSRAIDPSSDKRMLEMASGELIFNGKGLLIDEKIRRSAFSFGNGAAPNQEIKFDFGKSIKEGGKGTDASTQYGSNTVVSRHTSDGHSASPIASFSFDSKGVLNAVYENGETRAISQIAIAKFENNEGLYKLGKNLYQDTSKSGSALMGKPEEGGRGEVISKSLELSNVDIADQFVNLMTSQRNFQANAKTLQTADQMLQEVLNIKR